MPSRRRGTAGGASLYVTQKEVAAMTCVTTSTILRWAATGANGFPAPSRVIGRTRIFERARVERFLAGMQTAGTVRV